MHLTASDFYLRYRPSRCDLRVFLRARGEPEGPTSPYHEVIRELGDRHEQSHLMSLQDVTDLSGGDEESRVDFTRRALESGTGVLFQPAFSAELTLGGVVHVVRGDPDFLLANNGSHVIRDCKINRRVTDRPEICLQLQLYGWLYERTTGVAPHRLEVLNGRGELVEIDYDGGKAALEELECLAEIQASADEPFEPVGWTKCGGCPYRERCWSAAKERQDVALVLGVDQNLVRALRDDGVETIDQLRARHSAETLAEFKKPRGDRLVRVGKAADAILRSANCLAENREEVVARPDLPCAENLVMFDLEGLPPQLDELDKVFLWGMQVFGRQPSDFQAALAGFGPAGDLEGWEAFLAKAEALFDAYGDAPFVHWHHYERTKLSEYVKRYGDRDGIAHRVMANLVDLLPLMQKAIMLPLSSYSLKVVEKYVGFERGIEEGKGDWAMAKYIQACETDDESLRASLMSAVLDYNREDLEATWAVYQWLQARFN